MITIGTVTGLSIEKNRDGTTPVRMLQVQFSNESDIQQVQYAPLSGDDNPPVIDDQVVVLSIGPAFKVALGVNDGLTPSMNTGERKLYSRDSAGAIVAFISLLSSGIIDVTGSGINLDGTDGSGVLAGCRNELSICNFTGNPVGGGSTNVKCTL